MKYIHTDRIKNIPNTDIFDQTFVFPKMAQFEETAQTKIIFLKELLAEKKNSDIVPHLVQKPAMYSNMYSAKDELEIFESLFNEAIKKQEKIHIVGVTLKEELDILESYYADLWFMRDDINCFRVDFSVPLVTVSANIENLMWKGSDYKAQRDAIYYIPPIRESSQNKALFKGINRWVIAGIHIQNLTQGEKEFLASCVSWEKILPLTLWKVLFYNLKEIWISGEKEEIQIAYM